MSLAATLAWVTIVSVAAYGLLNADKHRRRTSRLEGRLERRNEQLEAVKREYRLDDTDVRYAVDAWRHDRSDDDATVAPEEWQ